MEKKGMEPTGKFEKEFDVLRKDLCGRREEYIKKLQPGGRKGPGRNPLALFKELLWQIKNAAFGR